MERIVGCGRGVQAVPAIGSPPRARGRLVPVRDEGITRTAFASARVSREILNGNSGDLCYCQWRMGRVCHG